MVETRKRFKFGWFGDGGLGEKLIQKIVSGQKTATSCPSYDPDDADLRAGDLLELTDKHGRVRAQLTVTQVELRATGRELRSDEEMRVVYFRLLK